MKHPQYIGIDPKNEVELVNLSAEGRFRVKEVKEMSSPDRNDFHRIKAIVLKD
jgi:hypothetical protein